MTQLNPDDATSNNPDSGRPQRRDGAGRAIAIVVLVAGAIAWVLVDFEP